MDEGGRKEEVGAEPRMELRQLAADRRHADRVLEETPRVDVVTLGRRRESTQALPSLGVEHRRHGRTQSRVEDLGGEKVEEAVELVGVPPHRRRERRRIGLGLLDRADVELEPVPEPLDSTEHPNRVPFAEARVEKLDVVPHTPLDSAGRVDELEREVVGPGPRPKATLAGDRVDAVDEAILGELSDGRHESSLRGKAAGRLAAVARISPFRAIRYDVDRAGPLGRLIAPPYDVISPEERARYLAASPYNVVHLTLPDDERETARLWHEWQGERILEREAEPALWWLVQDYVGPDGVARARSGLVCALHVEPYSARVVLPHERTHAGPKEGRMRLLRALRAHVEPIFLLYDGALGPPDAEPEVDVELEGVRNRLSRLTAPPPAELAGAQLLIADGHHRYETALAFHEAEGTEESGWLLAVIVPTKQEGLTIFATHRLVDDVDCKACEATNEAPLTLLERGEGPVLYRDGRAYLLVTDASQLDVSAVEPLIRGDVRYTPDAAEAVSLVDRGEAGAAILIRPPSIEHVQAFAARGETMPQKTTYFYPKLPSGLLFLPL